MTISWMFIYPAIKHSKELWRAENGSVRTHEKREGWSSYQNSRQRTHQYPLWKHKITSPKLNIPTQLRLVRDDLCMTAHLCSEGHHLTPALKEIWRPRANVSSSGMPRTGTKTYPSWMRKFSPSRSSITTSTARFMLKCPLRCVLRVQEGHRPSYIMVWWEVFHQGVTHLHFCKEGVKLVSECIKRTCYKELWNILTWPSSMIRNWSSSRLSSCPKGQDNSGVAAEEPSGLHQRLELAFGECRHQNSEQ